MASSAMGLTLGFLPTKHAKTNASTIFVRRFTHVYLHAQIALDCTYAPDKSGLLWLREKPEDPQFERYVGMKVVQVLVSPLYI